MNWIRTKDQLPKEGQNVICATKMDGETWWFGCCKYQGFFPWVRFDNSDSVEFWMTLPEPPDIAMDIAMDMSKEEFLEKHGDVVLTFSSYYKYAFYYTAELENDEKIYASIDGSSDDICSPEVKNNEQIKLRDLEPDSAYLYKGKEAKYGFYDY